MLMSTAQAMVYDVHAGTESYQYMSDLFFTAKHRRDWPRETPDCPARL